MERPDWAPEGVDTEQPSAARMYDYYLGGSHNFAVDRRLGEQALAVMPDGPRLARANRAFLRRAVRYLTGEGVRQFLDIGSGIPTVGNVHEVAQSAAPDARVAYVDIDPVAVAHSRAILAGNDRTVAVQDDLRRAEAILDQPGITALFDLSQPVAVLLVAVLHFVPDADDPAGILARLGAAVPPGSYLVVSHGTDESFPEETKRLLQVYQRTATPLTMRDRPAVTRLFAGFDLVEPGVVWAPQWRPDTPEDAEQAPERSGSHVGVGRKPAG
jgi:SAM-dependent methyltransferase